MINSIKEITKCVELMDKQLRNDLFVKNGFIQEKKLWKNTYIKHQIDKRNEDGTFTINDHIRAMVYSMLSSGIVWERVEKGIDILTGRINPIDDIFHNYDVDYILQCNPDQLADEIKNLGCASQSTRKQMKAIVSKNINKLISYEKEFGSIDSYYKKFIEQDNTLKLLVKQLADSKSENKFDEMAEALIAEYLKNVGYDIAKPDRHIRRILGSKILGCSEYEEVPVNEAFDIVAEIAQEMNKPVAEVDYILWSYCANGYGEICTKDNPKCFICVAKQYCNKKEISNNGI